MIQIVKTYWGTFPQRDIDADMTSHPTWSIHTMTCIPARSSSELPQLIVVYNEERPVVTIPEPVKEDDPWNWKKKTPQVGDWPPGPQPTCKGDN